MNHAEFDDCADDYDQQLNRGLALSGESRDFFARGRLLLLRQCLDRLGVRPSTVLDYGCGTGHSTPLFHDILGARAVIGVDVSEKSLDVARRSFGGLSAEFRLAGDYAPVGQVDLAFCNGVFHHIPLDQRDAAVRYIADSLRPGGIFALWENNPWNPGTRFIMSRVAFDRDAIMLSARQTRNLVRRAGLDVVRTDYCFIFPKVLGGLRWIEPYVAGLPLGGQYQVLATMKAAANAATASPNRERAVSRHGT